MAKRYGSRTVLAATDLSVRAGDRIVLVGANGAGKTTLLRILAGLTRPSQGRVAWGEELSPEAHRRAVGFVAHAPLLYEELTADENLALVARLHRVDDSPGNISLALDRFGARSFGYERVSSLSRGQRQRVALARAFVTNPKLLLLDEPAANLDEEGRKRLNHALEQLPAHVAAVIATHASKELQSWANWTWEFDRGHIEDHRSPA